jgi:hydroxyacylglutathione hydrolase
MHAALQRLCSLPENTRVWCAHEYTAGNLNWAISQVQADEPLGQALRQRLAQVLELRAQGRPTIPSSVELELQTNLFVRAGSAERLAELRRSKDHWSG